MRTHTTAARGERDGESSGIGVSRACGTFGELLQGVLPDNDLDFLVTLPIELWSTARFTVDPTSTTVTVRPVHKRKSLALARALLARCGTDTGGALTIESDIPEGKGLASSSADLVATSRAICAAFGTAVPAATLEDLLRAIEPSDGVMYAGIVAFYHRKVRLRERLGYLPGLTIVGIDEGGAVPTVAFNRVPKPFDAADKREYGRLLDLLARATRARDLATVGEVATRSTVMNQKLRPKRTLGEIRRICREAGGLGVVSAHSGTVLGVLLDDDDPAYAERLDRVRRDCQALAGNAAVYRSLPTGLMGD